MSVQRKRRRTPFIAVSQSIARWIVRLAMTLLYRIRVHGLENFPKEDGLLICCNHQSYLDPLIMGVVCPRPVNYLGRKSLFNSPFLAWFLHWHDTIGIDREATGIGGMKEMLRRIKRGESVVMFPEGTRTTDGELGPLMLGFCAVAKRTKSTLVPVGFEGSYQSLPRTRKIPRLGRIHVVIGKPISFEEYKSLNDQETADLLAARMLTCLKTARRHWQRSQSWFG